MTQSSKVAVRLLLFGFLTLFLELAMIRFLSSLIWNLGYFPNFVLLSVFLGMGLGFGISSHLTEKLSNRLLFWSPWVFLALILSIFAFRPAVPGFGGDFSGNFGGELFFTATTARLKDGAGSALFFPVWFIWLSFVFAMISQKTGRLFSQLAPLRAYSFDILGSVIGVATFMLVSGLRIPAFAWFVLAAITYTVMSWDDLKGLRRASGIAFLLISAVCLVHESVAFQVWRGYQHRNEFHWSPYQHIRYRDREVSVNGIGHQEIIDPSKIDESFYAIPFKDRRKTNARAPLGRVLIIGAGTGNDVNTALKYGASGIDAVEIDPVIADLGKKYNPGRPYENSRVNLVVDDGRSFLTKTHSRYDLIIFALTDSLVRVSAVGQLRLENYLFTQETLKRAWEVLNPGGSVVFYNFYREDWLIDKLRLLLGSQLGQKADVLHRFGSFVVMKATKPAGALATPPVAAAEGSLSEGSLVLPSDNWPFLYLKSPRVPEFYVLPIALTFALAVLFLFLIEKKEGWKGFRKSWPGKVAFLLMGGAFLLLETKSVIQFALLFGTTWVNSSLVFLGILSSVLVANQVLDRWKNFKFAGWAFALLVVSCGVAYFVPVSLLLYEENKILRFVLACLLTFSPVFFANILFSDLFRTQKKSASAFGWNLMGALLGGALEYLAMLTGYRALIVVVGILYLAAFGCVLLQRRITVRA